MKSLKQSKAVLDSGLYTSDIKDKIRKWVIEDQTNPKWALMLSGVWLKDAKMLIGRSRCQVVSLERDHYIYERQCKEVAAWDRILPLKVNFSDFVRSHLSSYPPFDIYFLDFQGTITPNVENDIEKMFECGRLNGNIKRGASIAVTFAGARESQDLLRKTHCFRVVCHKSYKQFRDKRCGGRLHAIGATIINLAQNQGYFLETVQSLSYSNTEGKRIGTPMLFWLFRVK